MDTTVELMEGASDITILEGINELVRTNRPGLARKVINRNPGFANRFPVVKKLVLGKMEEARRRKAEAASRKAEGVLGAVEERLGAIQADDLFSAYLDDLEEADGSLDMYGDEIASLREFLVDKLDDLGRHGDDIYPEMESDRNEIKVQDSILMNSTIVQNNIKTIHRHITSKASAKAIGAENLKVFSDLSGQLDGTRQLMNESREIIQDGRARIESQNLAARVDALTREIEARDKVISKQQEDIDDLRKRQDDLEGRVEAVVKGRPEEKSASTTGTRGPLSLLRRRIQGETYLHYADLIVVTTVVVAMIITAVVTLVPWDDWIGPDDDGAGDDGPRDDGNGTVDNGTGTTDNGTGTTDNGTGTTDNGTDTTDDGTPTNYNGTEVHYGGAFTLPDGPIDVTGFTSFTTSSGRTIWVDEDTISLDDTRPSVNSYSLTLETPCDDADYARMKAGWYFRWFNATGANHEPSGTSHVFTSGRDTVTVYTNCHAHYYRAYDDEEAKEHMTWIGGTHAIQIARGFAEDMHPDSREWDLEYYRGDHRNYQEEGPERIHHIRLGDELDGLGSASTFNYSYYIHPVKYSWNGVYITLYPDGTIHNASVLNHTHGLNELENIQMPSTDHAFQEILQNPDYRETLDFLAFNEDEELVLIDVRMVYGFNWIRADDDVIAPQWEFTFSDLEGEDVMDIIYGPY